MELPYGNPETDAMSVCRRGELAPSGKPDSPSAKADTEKRAYPCVGPDRNPKTEGLSVRRALAPSGNPDALSAKADTEMRASFCVGPDRKSVRTSAHFCRIDHGFPHAQIRQKGSENGRAHCCRIDHGFPHAQIRQRTKGRRDSRVPAVRYRNFSQ